MDYSSITSRQNRSAQLRNLAINMRHLYKSFAFLIIAIMVAGCGQSAATPLSPGALPREATMILPTTAPAIEPTPVNTRVLPLEIFTPGPTPTITPIPDEVTGLVVEVIDGDTISVIMDGDSLNQAYEVRYLGIDAPPNTADEPWGVAAYETNRRLANLKVVRLVRDQTNFDDEERLLRYVYIGDELLSITLVEQGLARSNIVEPDTRFQEEILEAEDQARVGRLGLWGPAPPRSQPTSTGEADGDETETITPEPINVTATPVTTSTTTGTSEAEATPDTGDSDEAEATAEPTRDSEESQ